MMGISDDSTPATIADVRRIVREEREAWLEEFRRRMEAVDQEPAAGTEDG